MVNNDEIRMIFYKSFSMTFRDLCEHNKNTEKFNENLRKIIGLLESYTFTSAINSDSLKIKIVTLLEKTKNYAIMSSSSNNKKVLDHEKILTDMSPLFNEIEINLRKPQKKKFLGLF